MPLINKTGKSKGFAFIVTPEKVHQDLLKLDGTDLLGRELFHRRGDFNQEKGSKAKQETYFFCE